MNLLVCGRCSEANYRECKARTGLGEARETDKEWMQLSGHHHEFMIPRCSHHSELLDELHQLAELHRINGQRHPIIIVGVHLLSCIHVARLKSMVTTLSDRTRFLLTAGSHSRLPRALTNSCTIVRVPVPAAWRPALEPIPRLEPLLAYVEAACRAGKLAAFRELAYAMMTSGVPLATFALQLVAHCAPRMRDPAAAVALLAGAEADSKRLKKDVLAWEAVLLDLSSPILWAPEAPT